jgi:hypothetical protein
MPVQPHEAARPSIIAALTVAGLVLSGCVAPIMTAAGVGAAAGLVAANNTFGRSDICYAVDVDGNALYQNRFGRIVTRPTDTRVVVDC